MLGPRERSLLLQSLQPPDGYRLDRAIGTSYSLDLLALLTAPLAFTFFDWEDDEGRPSADPLALLEAVRRNADRITIFCQAGGIQVPRPAQMLIAWIERCVVEVRAPHAAGLFHPKVWVLRFTAEEQPVAYRLLCLSRNLTFDRSWDTALVLDAQLRDRTRAIAKNRPLSEFVAALPGMAARPLDAEANQQIAQMADELLRVEFELPEGFDDVVFQPLGHTQKIEKQLPFRPRGLVVVSPFLSADLLDDLVGDVGQSCTLVSRPEALQALPDTLLSRFAATYTLAPEADPESDEDDGGSEGDRLSGLHAKIYVEDDGWYAWVWTGSANATRAAFVRNVEFLVGLRGKKTQCGTQAFLIGPREGERGFLELLVPWSKSATDPDPAQARREQIAQELERLGRELASADLWVEARGVESSDAFDVSMVLRGAARVLPEQVQLRTWPTTLPADRAVAAQLTRGQVASFPQLSFEALTCFFAFELTWEEPGVKEGHRFALKLATEGFPADRRERVLHSLLKDREHVLRLLWLLLASEGLDVEQVIDVARTGEGANARWGGVEGIPLLEAMLRALERDPARLDDVHRLLSDLARTEEGRALLPRGLESIWLPIHEARERLRR